MTQLIIAPFELPSDGSCVEFYSRDQVQLAGYLVHLRGDGEVDDVHVERVRCGAYVLIGAQGLPLREFRSLPLRLQVSPGDQIAVSLRSARPKTQSGQLMFVVHPIEPPPPRRFALEVIAR